MARSIIASVLCLAAVAAAQTASQWGQVCGSSFSDDFCGIERFSVVWRTGLDGTYGLPIWLGLHGLQPVLLPVPSGRCTAELCLQRILGSCWWKQPNKHRLCSRRNSYLDHWELLHSRSGACSSAVTIKHCELM